MEKNIENSAPQKEVVVESEVKSLPKENKSEAVKKIFLYSLGGFFVFILIAIAIFGFIHVKGGATDGFAYNSAKLLHLNLLTVNKQKVPYTDYLDDMKAINIMKDYEEKNNPDNQIDLTKEQMSDQVVWRLVNNVMISQVAEKFEIKADKKDIETLKNEVLESFESESQMEEELIKRYGWNIAFYENKVIRPFVLQKKLSEIVESDIVALTEIRQKAESVLDDIKNGADFAEMAIMYGEDGTNQTGGDLGWFGKGDMVPQFEDAIFALKKGELSKELVETPFGFHIVKVDDTKTERVKDENGKWVNEPQVKASHILFLYPSFEKYMDTYLKQSEIKFNSNIHNPFEQAKIPVAVQ